MNFIQILGFLGRVPWATWNVTFGSFPAPEYLGLHQQQNPRVSVVLCRGAAWNPALGQGETRLWGHIEQGSFWKTGIPNAATSAPGKFLSIRVTLWYSSRSRLPPPCLLLAQHTVVLSSSVNSFVPIFKPFLSSRYIGEKEKINNKNPNRLFPPRFLRLFSMSFCFLRKLFCLLGFFLINLESYSVIISKLNV